MKAFALAAALVVAAPAPATFAGPVAPQMEPRTIHLSTAGDAADSRAIVVPLVLFLVIAAALASGSGSSSTPALSDARLKTAIVPVGSLQGGLTLYHFRYRGLPQRYAGVLAQEVLAHRPEAVVTRPGGYLAVDYGKLGMRMRPVD